MVSLLIVSHSKQLAEGVKEFVQQIAGEVVIAAAGGAMDGSIGTNPQHIADTLEQIATPDGTLILVDLLGAVISAETAIELVPDVKAIVSNAPLVEGAYFAALEAAAGATLEETDAAAVQARELIKVHD